MKFEWENLLYFMDAHEIETPGRREASVLGMHIYVRRYRPDEELGFNICR